MESKQHVWTLYDMEEKAYLKTSGYYGNEANIHGFKTKEDAQREVRVYYRSRKIRIKRFTITA